MKYLPIMLLLSLSMMLYWLLKDFRLKAWVRVQTFKFKNFMTNVYEFFTVISERIADDIEVY